MEKKITVIGLNGSPNRDGNTVTLLNWVLEGCAQAGATVELLHVCDYDINYCLGCNRCLKEGHCLIKDDFQVVCVKLTEADGIVVGSPVYADAPTAQLKTLMDRMTLLNLYASAFHEKMTIGVATSGLAPTRGVAKNIAHMFGLMCGIIGSTTVSITALKKGPQPLDRVHKATLPTRAGKLGGKMVQRIRSGKSVPTLIGLWIRVLRKYLLSKQVTNNPDTFTAVIKMRPDLYGSYRKDKMTETPENLV